MLESEDHECPQCHSKHVSPDTLIPNRCLRTAVTNFRNETGYTKAAPPIAPTTPLATEAEDVEPFIKEESLPDELSDEEPMAEVKEEVALEETALTPPAVTEEEKFEESKEPPPPGGEPSEEARIATPTVDEKSADERAASQSPPPATAAAPTPSPQSNSVSTAASNLALLAQKAPLLALQQALLQGSPLILGNSAYSVLLMNMCIFLLTI